MRIRSTLLVALLVVLANDAIAQRNFVYTARAHPGPSRIGGFRVTDQGSLVSLPGSPYESGGRRLAGAVSSNKNLVVSAVRGAVFTADAASVSISAFSLDRETGVLTLAPGSPVQVGELAFTVPLLELAVTPDGRFLVVAATLSSPYWIDVFKIGAGARLEAVPGARITGEGALGSIELTSDGQLLVAPMLEGGQVAVFRLGSGGRLAHVPGSPFEGDPECYTLDMVS